MASYGTSASGIVSVPREIHVSNDGRPGGHETKQWMDNSICTSKYTAVSFIPLSLLEQFRRIANLYFLFISVLMILGTYTSLFDSPLTPWSTLIVLFIVVTVSIIKNGLEDLKRHQADRRTNYRIGKKFVNDKSLNTEQYADVNWLNIKVGDIIKVSNNDDFPADMIVLCTSENLGAAYIETSNIDGETSLKLKASVRSADSSGLPLFNTPTSISQSHFTIQCDQPNSIIDQFNGTVLLNNKESYVDSASLLLRGSTLRNTKWILGVVVYTGKETKIVMNSRRAPFKLSTIERTMNNIIYVILAAQILLSVVSLILFIVWKDMNYDDLDYLCFNYTDSTNTLYSDGCSEDDKYTDGGYFLTFFILYSNFLPISMYVTVEICNYFQAYFIDSDVHMYHNNSNTPASAKTSDMNADLGMIEYIFCDKTGTLTENEMVYRQCSIAGHVHVNDPKLLENNLTYESFDNIKRHSNTAGTVYSEFILCMALCHTIVLDSDTGDVKSESPDESALYYAASDLGYSFVGRDYGIIYLENRTTKARVAYKLMATIPFDSTRKRMSIIVCNPENKYVLYSKGADNVMFDRAGGYMDERGAIVTDNSLRKSLDSHLDSFGYIGLRTLVLARKQLTVEEYTSFSNTWSEAERSRVNREELMATAARIVENNLIILGATGVEDRLQDGVPECVTSLRNAGIKLWVLTGDKVETAINIAYSTGFLGHHMMVIKLIDSNVSGVSNSNESEVLKRKLESLLNHFSKLISSKPQMDRIMRNIHASIQQVVFGKSSSAAENVLSDDENHASPMHGNDAIPLIDRGSSNINIDDVTSDHLSMIVDGSTLLKIFGDNSIEPLFLKLATICRTVVACRVSPEQKRLMVRMVKLGVSPRPVTLAIGDGANDVAMIQEAQIGVGISGKEGKQAVNSSDFSIAQFKYLKRLLLVHGRLDYRRTCKVVLYSFYKNIVLTLCMFFYTFYSGYSGQSLFDDYIHSAYNLILAWPVISFGAFDRDISAKTLLKYPILYISGRQRYDLNIQVIVFEMIQAILDSFIIFGISYYSYKEVGDVWSSDGKTNGIWIYGTVVYTALVFAMFARIAILTDTWTWITHVFFWGSIIVFLIFYFTYQYYITISYNFYGIANQMFSEPTLYWVVLVTVVGSTLLDLSVRMVQKEFFPTVVDIGFEIDSGLSKLDELYDGDNIKPSAEELMEENVVTESSLLYSSNLDSNRKHKIPLDWEMLSGYLSSMQSSEQQRLDIHNTDVNVGITSNANASVTFNFDHVAAATENTTIVLRKLLQQLSSQLVWSPSAQQQDDAK